VRETFIKLRWKLIPRESWREVIYSYLRIFLDTWKREGFTAAYRRSNKYRKSSFRGESGIGLHEYTYLEWIRDHEPSQEELHQQTTEIESFNFLPRISVLVPVYNPSPHILEETIHSVMAQTYPHWELCVVNGGSDRSGVREVLDTYRLKDDRIVIKHLSENLGISNNTNQAMEMASGEFVAFLDHDDLLAPFALYEVAKILNQHVKTDLIYSDHDRISSQHQSRHQPLFKPDWSPEIMLSANYITHLTVIRSQLVRDVGGCNSKLDGAQDWDLFFRITERTAQIIHIPKILYHWRESSESTAESIWTKSYVPEAQLEAITSHLDRLGMDEPRAFFDPSGYIRVHWKYIDDHKVSIIIPTRGANKLIRNCISTILQKTTYSNYEIIIVNNGQHQPDEIAYFRKLKDEKRIRILHFDQKFNYSAVNNFGAEHATGDIYLFLNNDTEIINHDWLDELVLWSEREDIGAVGAKLIQPNGRIQHAGVIIGLSGFAGHVFAGSSENQWGIFGLSEWYRDYKAITAACMMIRKDLFIQIGGFDENFILCGNDVELCLNLQHNGLRIVYNPFVKLMHIEGASRGREIPTEDYHTSYQHYLPVLESGDPYFNPNLSYWSLIPKLAEPNEAQPLTFVREYLDLKESNRDLNLG